MKNDEIISKSENVIKDIDNNYARDVCPGVYEQSKSGMCFALHEEDDVSASKFYNTMLDMGFTPYHRMRQDYLTWSGIIYTPDKLKTVIFSIRTLVNSKKDRMKDYELLKKGYRTFVEIAIDDAD